MAEVRFGGLDDGEGDAPLAPADGMVALLRFVRRAVDADFAIALEAEAGGLATPLASDPPIELAPFPVDSLKVPARAAARGPAVRLPSAVAVAAPIAQMGFIASPIPEGRRSGILLLWTAATPPGGAAAENPVRWIEDIAPAFSQMMHDRRIARHRRASAERFHDFFHSVPVGVVIFEGHGLAGQVNGPAAALLGLVAGERPASEIAASMRRLRTGSQNATALAHLYAPLQGNVDYAVKAVWDLGSVKLEVDTHPILGNGHNGRIWIFNDVTAQHLVQENLRQLSLSDPLTGLGNRRHFLEFGTLAFERDQVSGGPALAVLMIDIDRFKRINDTYGHAVGDEVLRAVAARLRALLREGDLIARLGGEEFAMVLAGLQRERIAETAERLRAGVAGEPVRTSSAGLAVSVSIGVAVRESCDANLAALLQRADRALYHAKHGGRDCVVTDAIPVV